MAKLVWKNGPHESLLEALGKRFKRRGPTSTLENHRFSTFADVRIELVSRLSPETLWGIFHITIWNLIKVLNI